MQALAILVCSNMDRHKKQRRVTFALDQVQYQQLEDIVRQINQPVQWVVGSVLEAMSKSPAAADMFPSSVPRLKFCDGKTVSIRVTDETYDWIKKLSVEYCSSTGYVARVFCLSFIELSLKKEQQKKEVEDRWAKPIVTPRSFWAALGTWLLGFIRHDG